MEVLERVCVKFEKEDEENWVKEGLKTLDRGVFSFFCLFFFFKTFTDCVGSMRALKKPFLIFFSFFLC